MKECLTPGAPPPPYPLVRRNRLMLQCVTTMSSFRDECNCPSSRLGNGRGLLRRRNNARVTSLLRRAHRKMDSGTARA